MTKKISEQELLRQFEDIARFELPQAAVERDLERIRRSVMEGDEAVFSMHQSVWKRLARSRWTQCLSAVAACLILAVAIHSFSDTQLSAAELLTRVAENLNKAVWIKTITRNYLPGQAEPASVDTTWTDLKGKKVYAIYDSTYVHLMDYEKMHWSIYNPQTQAIVVKKLDGQWTGPGTQLIEYVRKLRDEGLEVIQSEERRDGVKMTIIAFDEVLNNMSPNPNQFMSKMSFGGMPVKTIRTRLAVDPAQLHLGEAERSYFDVDEAPIITMKSEAKPQDTGPADIYELGVPREVTIINKVPGPRVEEIRGKIREHRDRFLKHYVAVQTEARIEAGQETIIEAKVIYRQGEKLRVDVFFNLYGRSDGLTGRWAEVLATSLTHVKPYWSNPDGYGVRSVRIYDGLWQHILEKRENQMILRAPQRRPDGDAYSDDDLEDFGWRTLWWLGEPEHMYDDDFAHQNGLLAMELTGSGLHRLPKRQVLYVDPAQDYLSRRYRDEELLDAPWQEDKSRADSVQGQEELREQVRTHDVIEYGRTSGGQWYPKVVTIKGYDRTAGRPDSKHNVDRVSRIYLIQENPHLPDALFDPNQLDREDRSR